MYTLHLANKLYSSWSLRPWLLMTELGIPFEEVVHPLGQEPVPGGYRAFSPSSRAPCLHHEDRVIWDSLAITEYLAEAHPGVWPRDAGVRAWARCAVAEMHSGFQALRSQCSMHCALRVRLHAMTAPLRSDIDRVVELWTQGLDRFGGPYLAGPAFSAVDAFYAPVAIRFQGYGIEVSRPAEGYAARLLALPGMRAWMDAALKEPWVEPGHEDEIRAVGTVTADLRQRG